MQGDYGEDGIRDRLSVVTKVTDEEVDALVEKQLHHFEDQKDYLCRISGAPYDVLVANELAMLIRSFGDPAELPLGFLRSLFWDSDNVSSFLLNKGIDNLDKFSKATLVREWSRCMIYLEHFKMRREFGEW